MNKNIGFKLSLQSFEMKKKLFNLVLAIISFHSTWIGKPKKKKKKQVNLRKKSKCLVLDGVEQAMFQTPSSIYSRNKFKFVKFLYGM